MRNLTFGKARRREIIESALVKSNSVYVAFWFVNKSCGSFQQVPIQKRYGTNMFHPGLSSLLFPMLCFSQTILFGEEGGSRLFFVRHCMYVRPIAVFL